MVKDVFNFKKIGKNISIILWEPNANISRKSFPKNYFIFIFYKYLLLLTTIKWGGGVF